MRVISLIGPTGAGKSTVLHTLKELSKVKTATIEIGKVLRAKYPPSYFNGSMAPAHTENEVIELFNELYDRAVEDKAALLIVDGQPRTRAQVDQIVGKQRLEDTLTILHLYADYDTRKKRVDSRDTTLGGRMLNEGRLKNDAAMLYELLTYVSLAYPDAYVETVDTGKPAFNAKKFCESILCSQ